MFIFDKSHKKMRSGVRRTVRQESTNIFTIMFTNMSTNGAARPASIATVPVSGFWVGPFQSQFSDSQFRFWFPVSGFGSQVGPA